MNTTAFTYNALGRTTSLATTAAGPVTRASYALTLNAAGQLSAEASTITGDPTNGTTTYTYDALARLTAYTRSGTTTAYGWQATPNRSSVQVGAAAATTYTFDDANRVTADSAGGTYTADADGRLTSRPGQRLAWDSLGRLRKVLPPTGAGTLATYAYDPLDRLLLADDGTTRTRFRYVGQTTAIAQTVNDQNGAVITSIGNDWTGEHRLDWTGSGQNIRSYGTNAHHDLTWTADATGTVSATLRYDPWGTLTSSTGTSLPPFRFQGSWADPATNLSWVITRWYAPALGSFISEDSLTGDPADPPSRHLYAYAQGNPVLGWDPDGRFWYRVRSGETLQSIAAKYWGSSLNWPTIWNANRGLIPLRTSAIAGKCIWIRRNLDYQGNYAPNQCPGTSTITGAFPGTRFQTAARTLGVDWYNLTWEKMVALTMREVGRTREPNLWDLVWYVNNTSGYDSYAFNLRILGGYQARRVGSMRILVGNPLLPPPDYGAITVGHNIFTRREYVYDLPLLSHEYIHVLQEEHGGWLTLLTYEWRNIVAQEGTGATNRSEAIGYLWQGWLLSFRRYGEKAPWCYYIPITGREPWGC